MNLRDQFKLKVYQYNAAQYEDFFNNIMKASIEGFQSVKPHGNIGDRGNDGWVYSTGTYYQVYAPEELFKNTKEAIIKVKNDFEKLKQYWDGISRIRSFYFVINDKFHGVSPHIFNTLEELKIDHGLENTGVFSVSELEKYLFMLPQDSICSLLGVQIQQVDQAYEDRKKARVFLDNLEVVINELFESGRSAGYFFPTNVFYYVSEMSTNDWKLKKMFCCNNSIASHQQNMWYQLVQMCNEIIGDSYYENIGLAFKFKPPFELVNRDLLIENKQDMMGELINKFANSYIVVRDYSV